MSDVSIFRNDENKSSKYTNELKIHLPENYQPWNSGMKDNVRLSWILQGTVEISESIDLIPLGEIGIEDLSLSHL